MHITVVLRRLVHLPLFKTTASRQVDKYEVHNPSDLVFKNEQVHESVHAPEGQVEYSKHSYEKLKPNYLSFWSEESKTPHFLFPF